jgi:hypothetical protein
MKLFFSATFGSISGMLHLISLLACVTYDAESPPVTPKCVPFREVFIVWSRKMLHRAKSGE